jgi:hypothetical protein
VKDRRASRKEKGIGMQSYRELEVWQLSRDLAEECFRVTKGFRKEELFGMTSQIRRAAASIPANIEEGQGREHTKEILLRKALEKRVRPPSTVHPPLSTRRSPTSDWPGRRRGPGP